MSTFYENDDEIEYFYENGEVQFYLYKDVYYAAQYPEYWAKFQYKNGSMFQAGPSHCIFCIHHGTLNGVMVGPCEECAPRYNDYELGPGFNNCKKERTDVMGGDGQIVLSVFELHFKHINRNSIGRNGDFEEPIHLDDILETECTELRNKLFEKHGNEKVEYDAIEGLMRFIKSFTNPEEMRKKINTALLIPDSKMYNQNWAGTDWDWFTGQLNTDEIAQWTFTDEERESIRISKETIRSMVEASRRELTSAKDSKTEDIV